MTAVAGNKGYSLSAVVGSAVAMPRTGWGRRGWHGANAAGPANSFAQQLVSAIQDYLGRTDPGTRLQIDIQPNNGQGSGARQFIVTVTDPNAGAPADAAAPPAVPVSATPPVGVAAQPDSSSVPQIRPMFAMTDPSSPPLPGPKMPYRNSAEAYWAAQPPEVQALRTIQDKDAREAKAQQLAAKGFTIDYPIMVWQWDPLSTMRERINDGYTWVPAVGQPSIEVTAGATFPGLKSYDPANPPPGSILVSTAFADGYDS